ncbi:MAG: hypothetical protein M3Y89_04320, partial [Actinomycetota bacterium]|nr:hypothetical protein [Actinomycetota bacterium]
PGSYPPPPAAGHLQPPGGHQAPPPSGEYQAPPATGYQAPPSGEYQAPPATGYQAPEGGVGAQFSNFDPKTLQNFDPKTVNPLDWGIIAAGVVAFIFSTFGFYKYSVSVAGFSNSATVSAWHGFFGWFGVLVALAASIVLAIQLIAKIELPFSVRTVVLGAFALATLCLLLALFVVPGNTGGAGGVFGVKIDKGHGFGYWVTFLAVIVGTGLSAKRFTDSGGKLPSRG